MNTQNTHKFFFKSISIALLVVFTLSCNQANLSEEVSIAESDVNYSYDGVEAKEMADESQTSENSEIEGSIIQDLKIIKTASIRFKVASVKNGTQQIKAMVNNYHGYISDMRYTNDLYSKENRFTIKVPKNNFDIMLDSVSTIAEFIDHIEVTSEDVTEKYMDIETRLKTKIEVKARYEEILRKNAKTVKDILVTEEKLRIIQEEIEVAQGKLKYMSSRVAFSTINVSLYETIEYKDEPEVYKRSFGSKITEALTHGWDLIKNLFLGLLYIWPLILLVTIVIFIIKKRRKNKKK